MSERLYLVAYDIAAPKRWRRVFKALNGYGTWLQLSVFQCRLSPHRHAALIETLAGLIDTGADRVLVVDLGPADRVSPRITSLGSSVTPIERAAMVV